MRGSPVASGRSPACSGSCAGTPLGLASTPDGRVGFYLERVMKLRPDFVRERADELLELWSQRVIVPLVGATFPLAAANDAHALIETRKHVGKVVLEP